MRCWLRVMRHPSRIELSMTTSALLMDDSDTTSVCRCTRSWIRSMQLPRLTDLQLLRSSRWSDLQCFATLRMASSVSSMQPLMPNSNSVGDRSTITARVSFSSCVQPDMSRCLRLWGPMVMLRSPAFVSRCWLQSFNLRTESRPQLLPTLARPMSVIFTQPLMSSISRPGQYFARHSRALSVTPGQYEMSRLARLRVLLRHWNTLPRAKSLNGTLCSDTAMRSVHLPNTSARAVGVTAVHPDRSSSANVGHPRAMATMPSSARLTHPLALSILRLGHNSPIATNDDSDSHERPSSHTCSTSPEPSRTMSRSRVSSSANELQGYFFIASAVAWMCAGFFEKFESVGGIGIVMLAPRRRPTLARYVANIGFGDDRWKHEAEPWMTSCTFLPPVTQDVGPGASVSSISFRRRRPFVD
eukprot:PhM_4_TR18269/c0_g1_i1/m.51677